MFFAILIVVLLVGSIGWSSVGKMFNNGCLQWIIFIIIIWFLIQVLIIDNMPGHY